MIERVVLIGLSGVGKSTTAHLIGSQLGWPVIDLDQTIEQETGLSIPEIFRSHGETRFRSIERAIFRGALARSRVVIATGGGAPVDPEIWDDSGLGDSSTMTVWLDAKTERLVERLQAQAVRDGDRANRPLLEGDPYATITAMRVRRTLFYAQATVALDVTERTPTAVALDVSSLVRLGRGEPLRIRLEVERATSEILIGARVSSTMPEVIRDTWPDAQQVFVACDERVASPAANFLSGLQLVQAKPMQLHEVPAGESSKSVAGLTGLWDWMLGAGVQRGDVLVALGGGVVGDLAGFAAATVLRGIGLLQVPTTLLSMVDSSVGGKTAINHQAGKNLIGAFHQARSVLIDSIWLATLPEREYRSGWAEIIKHAVIEASTPGGQPPVLLDILERNHEALMARREPLLSWVIGRNVEIKAAVVAADEREAGIRAYLNFGHTIGHGIEAAGYSLLHGEAVAVGMSAALDIATRMDFIEPGYAERIRHLMEKFGLPAVANVDPTVVLQKMAGDKKKYQGKQTWVLPKRGGGVALRRDVPTDIILHAIDSVTGRG